jgi:hypothetical protein
MKQVILNNGFILQEGKKYRNAIYGKNPEKIYMSRHSSSDQMKTLVNFKFVTVLKIISEEGSEVQLVFDVIHEQCSSLTGNKDIRGCFSYAKKFLAELLIDKHTRFEI